MPRTDEITLPLREAFAARTKTNPEDWFCTFKARYGMREVFSALHEILGEGNVVTTLFTGCTAVDSILAANMHPRYADISCDTLSLDACALEVGKHDYAVLLQNTYGMIDDQASALLAQKTHQTGALLVEDSAHCLARMATDSNGNIIADISIHSFGIEKTFSDIYFGGAIWVNPDMERKDLHDAIVAHLAACGELPQRLSKACARYRTHARILSHLPATLSKTMRKLLLHTGLYEPPVADIERLGGLPYPSYLPNEWMVNRILPRFAGLDIDESQRCSCVINYQTALRELMVEGQVVSLEDAHQQGDAPCCDMSSATQPWIPSFALAGASPQAFLRFPLVMPNEESAKELISALSLKGFYAVRWYYQPFFPGAADVSAFEIGLDDERLVSYHNHFAGVVGLPCDIAPERTAEVIEVLHRVLARQELS